MSSDRDPGNDSRWKTARLPNSRQSFP
jgi:hypothetical protein